MCPPLRQIQIDFNSLGNKLDSKIFFTFYEKFGQKLMSLNINSITDKNFINNLISKLFPKIEKLNTYSTHDLNFENLKEIQTNYLEWDVNGFETFVTNHSKTLRKLSASAFDCKLTEVSFIS